MSTLSKGKIKRKFHYDGKEFIYIIDEYGKNETRIYQGKNNLQLTLIGTGYHTPKEVKEEFQKVINRTNEFEEIILSEMNLVYKKIIKPSFLGFRNSNTTLQREISIYQGLVEKEGKSIITGLVYTSLVKHLWLLNKFDRERTF